MKKFSEYEAAFGNSYCTKSGTRAIDKSKCILPDEVYDALEGGDKSSNWRDYPSAEEAKNALKGAMLKVLGKRAQVKFYGNWYNYNGNAEDKFYGGIEDIREIITPQDESHTLIKIYKDSSINFQEPGFHSGGRSPSELANQILALLGLKQNEFKLITKNWLKGNGWVNIGYGSDGLFYPIKGNTGFMYFISGVNYGIKNEWEGAAQLPHKFETHEDWAALKKAFGVN